jgi:hypothetical protein
MCSVPKKITRCPRDPCIKSPIARNQSEVEWLSLCDGNLFRSHSQNPDILWVHIRSQQRCHCSDCQPLGIRKVAHQDISRVQIKSIAMAGLPTVEGSTCALQSELDPRDDVERHYCYHSQPNKKARLSFPLSASGVRARGSLIRTWASYSSAFERMRAAFQIRSFFLSS